MISSAEGRDEGLPTQDGGGGGRAAWGVLREKVLDWSKNNNHGKEEERDEPNFLAQWAEMVSQFSSFHGVSWHSRLGGGRRRVLLFAMVMGVSFVLPVLSLHFFLRYLNEVSLSDSVLWTKASAVQYPNITICHPNYFSRERMEEQGISEELANYMTMTFDPGTANLLHNYLRSNNSMADRIFEQADILDQTLANRSVDLFQLMSSISVRCSDLVMFCEVHSRAYFTGAGAGAPEEEEDCCRRFFDGDRPSFTVQGTCFNARMKVYERSPFSWSSVEIWLRYDREDVPDMSLSWKGVNAVQRNAVFYSMTSRDHPVFALYRDQYRANPGEATTVALRIRQIDRTELGDDFCESEAGARSFEASNGGLPYTKDNCDVLRGWRAVGEHSNCSYSAYLGLERDPLVAPCTPRFFLDWLPYAGEALERAEAEDEQRSKEGASAPVVIDPPPGGEGGECKFECKRVEYIARTQYGSLNEKTMSSVGLNASNTAVLQFYFESFDYERHTIKRETLIEFLSKVGGWLSLAVGASAISFLELGYFLWLLASAAMAAVGRAAAGRAAAAAAAAAARSNSRKYRRRSSSMAKKVDAEEEEKEECESQMG